MQSYKEKYGQWALCWAQPRGSAGGRYRTCPPGNGYYSRWPPGGQAARTGGVHQKRLRPWGHGHGIRPGPPGYRGRLLLDTADLEIGLVCYVASECCEGPFVQTPYADFEDMLQVNVRSFTRLLHHFAGLFCQRGRGAFVTIGALAGWTGQPNCSVYAAHKAYMMSLTEGVAYELRDCGAHILMLAAGPIVERKPTRPVNAHDACALTAEEFVSEGFNQLGLKRSYVVGEQNRKQLSECITMDRDLMVASRCPSPNERAKAHPVH